MHRCSTVRLFSAGVNNGRLKLATQFASMEGWQANQDSRFDEYVAAHRKKEHFDALDQRVERAYMMAARQHKAEVVNGFKRRLKGNGDKVTAEVLREMGTAVEERLEWLRDVWAQIDADYRGKDVVRQQKAADEISMALSGEQGEYMQWVYDTKREKRSMGKKGKAMLESELAGANLPEVAEEEANRYHALKMSMTDIERHVKTRFGLAGQQHWETLQNAKDEEYLEKLTRAEEKYKELLKQDERYEESKRTELLRSNIERVHQAQVRFKAAMEMENERLKLIEAHKVMSEERVTLAKEARREQLKEAAKLRAEGKHTDEIVAIMKERSLDKYARERAESQLREQQHVQAKKEEFSRMIRSFKEDMESREGEALLARAEGLEERQQSKPRNRLNVFGFAEEDLIEDANGQSPYAVAARGATPRDAVDEHRRDQYDDVARTSSKTDVGDESGKKQLWNSINSDSYEDPFLTVHQARMDAAKTYDPIYARTFPTNLALGRKYSRQGTGEDAAGNAQEGRVLQSGRAIAARFAWGVGDAYVHDLDAEQGVEYFTDGAAHVRDKNTGDIDWRFERRKGGAVFRGPRFYKLGEEREAKDAGEKTMEPTPPRPMMRHERIALEMNAASQAAKKSVRSAGADEWAGRKEYRSNPSWRSA